MLVVVWQEPLNSLKWWRTTRCENQHLRYRLAPWCAFSYRALWNPGHPARCAHEGGGGEGRSEDAVSTFTQEEAEAKVGTFIKTRIPIAGLPGGSRGTVTRVLCLPDGYAVIVRWQWPRPRAMWFDKEVYQYALVEAVNRLDC